MQSSDIFQRAHTAIIEAHRLSQTLHEVATRRLEQVARPGSSDQSLGHEADFSARAGEVQPLPGNNGAEADGAAVSTPPAPGANLSSTRATLDRLVSVASRLATLRNEHQATLSHLVRLRLQQIQLRKQQLSALHGLLSSQLQELGDIHAHPLQRTVLPPPHDNVCLATARQVFTPVLCTIVPIAGIPQCTLSMRALRMPSMPPGNWGQEPL
jgi:hypothetical protein